MILLTWVAGAIYRSGDYVEDPTNHSTYQVICPEHKDVWDCAVTAGEHEPHNNHEQLVEPEDLPTP